MTRRVLRSLVLAALVAACLAAPAHAAGSRTHTHTVSYDRYSFSLDGQRVWLWSAEFHYFRLPNPDLWRDQLEKLKAAGFNTVSLYFSWAYHSPAPGVFDFSGVRDLDRLLDIAQEVGLYVIARPGPYVNAELDSGGFPAWLTTQAGRARTNADDYQAAWEQWFSAVNRIIARHQFTDGRGPVILYQIENEYDGSDAVYMEELKAAARRDGITVPLFHNDKGRNLLWSAGPGAPEIYATDTYPAGFDCNRTSFPGLTDYRFLRDGTSFNPPRPGVGNRPFFFAEFQGGAFDPWGGPGYDRCRALTGPAFERMFYANNIENQFTAQNLYMTYGGTNWGWQADPNVVYTSYDYGAAFNEQRQLTEKVPVLKQLGSMVATVRDLLKADDLGEVASSNPAIRVWAKENPDTGSRFYFVRHAGNGTAATDDTTTFSVSVPDGTYTASVRVNGRDFKILPAGYDLERQRLVYSTSEIYTHMRAGSSDVALLHGRRGESGETVLRYRSRPHVKVLAGDVSVAWDGARGDLRLSYVHDGLARVSISGGGRPRLTLLLADSDTASTFWRVSTARGPVLVRGAYLVRSASWHGSALALKGDTESAGEVEVFDARARSVSWNDRPLHARRTASGSLLGSVGGPRPVQLPALSAWRYSAEAPEAQPGFDDSGWTVADKTTTNNPTKPATLPVLYTDDYGFHYGDVWYRGHFTATGAETALALTAGTGRAGAWQVWVNGTHLGTVRTGTASGNQNSSATLALPAGLLSAGPGQRDLRARAQHGPQRGRRQERRAEGAARPAVRFGGRLGRAGELAHPGRPRGRGPRRSRARPAEQRRPVRRALRVVAARLRRLVVGERVAAPPRVGARCVVVPHPGQARPAARPGRARRPALHRRSVAPLPRADLRQRLERRAVRQRRRPAARLRPAAGDPAPPGDEHDRFGGVVRRRGHAPGSGAVDLVALGNTATSLRVHDVYSPG